MKKIYIIISIIILIALLVGYIANKKIGFIQTNDDAKRIYKQGLRDIEANDLQNAYFNFSKISQFNSLYETALFHQGLIASELNDNDSAIRSYETLLEKFPNTFFKEKSIYNLAIAYFNKNEKERAYANFQLITKKFANSDYADASNYFLGVLIKNNDKNKAAGHFINYLDIAPVGKYALSSIEELSALKTDLSQEQKITLGKALLLNNRNDDAIETLKITEISKSWALLALAYMNKGDIKTSKQIILDGIKNYSTNNDEFQQKAIDLYVAKSNLKKEKALKELKALCDKSKCQLNDYIMYSLIPYVDNNIKYEYYNRIYEEFSKGNYAADALFNSLFNDYMSGSYDNAIIKAKKHISKYSDKKSAPAAMYWLGKTYEKKHNQQEANAIYNKVFTKYTDTYYGYLAATKINKIKNPYDIKNFTPLPNEPIYINLPIIHANLPINTSKKIDELLKIGDFDIFDYADFDNEIIKSWVSYYKGDLAQASVIAEKILEDASVKPTFDDDIYKLIYPIGFSKYINEASKNNTKISAYLLISIIRKESRFNPKAVSISGALGLTQLMPETAKYISGLSGIKYDYNKIFEPEYNINLGAKYYNYIKQNHHSNDLYAIASYNGGHFAVEKWKNKLGVSDLEEFVEKIPYKETQDYVKQVYRNYWVYNCIYNYARVK